MLLTLLLAAVVLTSCKQPENQSISIREPYQKTMKVDANQSIYLSTNGFELPGIGQVPLYIKVVEGQNSILAFYNPLDKTIELLAVRKGSVIIDIYTPDGKHSDRASIEVVE